ncbi:equilibrative nucleoside transporter 4-like isoform X2 [Tubulanus polymorphus]|uniref:equilibrative nucleoside transporter 4-like isoform X2 n=1 Tax=Tubulanus polymorphus TaxID=672921 RepID=UPI003DA26503
MDANLTRGYFQIGNANKSGSTSNTRNSLPPLPPRDPCGCIYLALLLAGAGFLLPYNSFITAVDYFQGKYPGSTIVFDMSITYIVVAFISVCVNNVLVETFSLTTRITFGYVVSFLMLTVVTICEIWLEVFSHSVAYTINLIAVAVVALGCTVQQSSFYGYTSMLPRRYTQAVMTGESAAGLLVSVNRIVTKLLLRDEKINTIIFFMLSILIVWMCFIVFHVTRRTQFVRFYVSVCESAGVADDQRGMTTSGANPEEVDIIDTATQKDGYGVLEITSPGSTPTQDTKFNNIPQCQIQSTSPSVSCIQPNTNTEVTFDNEVRVQCQGKSYKKHISLWDSIKHGVLMRHYVSRNIWPYMVSIAAAYLVTLSLFPGIESEIISCRLGSWMPVILMAAFNLADFIGKIIAAVPYDWPPGRLLLFSVLRILIVPLMMLCAAPRKTPLLQHEAWPILFSAVLGLSNGYFGSVPMIIAPSRVPDDQKELTGNIMTLSYSVGLTAGSGIAYLLDLIIGPHPLHYCDYTHLTLARWNSTTPPNGGNIVFGKPIT